MTNRDTALHAARVCGWLTRDRLVSWGVPEPEPTLAALVEERLADLARTPRGDIYRLTPAGTERARDWAAAWLAGQPPGTRARLTELLARFEQRDPELKRLITRWQSDSGAGVAGELSALHQEARPILCAIADAGPQWSTYPRRLDRAVEQVAGGDLKYVASPLLDSYHTVWHLMHQDLRTVVAGER
jgi:hypothetical protein